MPGLRSYDNHSKYSNFHNYKKTNVKYKKLMQNVQNVQIAKRTHIVNIDDFTNDAFSPHHWGRVALVMIVLQYFKSHENGDLTFSLSLLVAKNYDLITIVIMLIFIIVSGKCQNPPT